MKWKKEDNIDGDVFFGLIMYDDVQDEKKLLDKICENMNKFVNELVQFSDKKEKENVEEDEEGMEDELYDFDLIFVFEIIVLLLFYEFVGE